MATMEPPTLKTPIRFSNSSSCRLIIFFSRPSRNSFASRSSRNILKSFVVLPCPDASPFSDIEAMISVMYGIGRQDTTSTDNHCFAYERAMRFGRISRTPSSKNPVRTAGSTAGGCQYGRYSFGGEKQHGSARRTVDEDVAYEVHVYAELKPPRPAARLQIDGEPCACRHENGNIQQGDHLYHVPSLPVDVIWVQYPCLLLGFGQAVRTARPRWRLHRHFRGCICYNAKGRRRIHGGARGSVARSRRARSSCRAIRCHPTPNLGRQSPRRTPHPTGCTRALPLRTQAAPTCTCGRSRLHTSRTPACKLPPRRPAT